MRTISLEKMNMIRRILFVVIMLLAFAMVFTVTAKPSHAATYTLEGEYTTDNGVTNPASTTTFKPTEFKLYKVGSFVSGSPYVELDSPYSEMGIELPLNISKDNPQWTEKWLTCASTLRNELPEDAVPAATDTSEEGTDGHWHFSMSGLENGLYLLVGNSQLVKDYPTVGKNSYWWPQPMLVSILNGNAKVTVKPMTGLALHLKVMKVWQWPEGLEQSIKDLVRPKSITVVIKYNDKVKYTKEFNDEFGWSFEWDSGEGEEDPELWTVDEVISDSDLEEFNKNFTHTIVSTPVEDPGSGDVVGENFTITNKYDRDTLEIVKRLNGFVDNGGESIALTFELSGYKGDSRIFHKFVGMEFDANSGDTKTLPVKDIPLGLTRLVVKEVSSSNYTPDPAEQDATPPVKNDDGTKGPYTVSFTNNLTNQIYNSGIVNKFKLTQKGYEFVKRQGTGE